VRTALVFVLVLFTWVFFRAPDLPSALGYLSWMFGAGEGAAGSGLVGGLIYQPYYLLTMVVAAFVAWRCPQTWDWTRTLTPARAVGVAAAFAAAAVMLTTQAFNPFIYFIF
jgi:alginate O-acetyltransferase complex protein AlgI